MSIKMLKPTTPGQRGMSKQGFEEITSILPSVPCWASATAPAAAPTPAGSPPATSAAATSALPHHRLQAQQGRRPGPGRHHRVRPQPHRPHRAAGLRRRREALHPGPRRAEGGRTVVSGKNADILVGNTLPLKGSRSAPKSTTSRCKPGKGGQIARAAGTFAAAGGQGHRIRPAAHALRRDPQGRLECSATIGKVGNLQHENVSLGKAGRAIWLGVRPTVRGVVMNPVDHPHGGGEGRTSGGRHP